MLMYEVHRRFRKNYSCRYRSVLREFLLQFIKSSLGELNVPAPQLNPDLVIEPAHRNVRLYRSDQRCRRALRFGSSSRFCPKQYQDGKYNRATEASDQSRG